MPIDAFLKLVEQTTFADTVRDSIWMFPVIESVHVISFTIVVGTIAIIDLRLLGVASVGRSFHRMSLDIMKWAWGAFALAVLTGLMMFTTNARIYYHNPFFRTKMILLICAGVNVLIFQMTAGRTSHLWDKGRAAPRAGKTAAVLSLALWVTIIFMGRIIGFTTHPGKVLPPPPGVNFENFLQPVSTPSSGGTSTAPTPPANPAKK